MNENIVCQSCGILLNNEILGTNIDGSLSGYYCKYCFQNGNFTEQLTLNEAISKIVENAEQEGISKEEALRYASKHLPNLKRWQSN